MKKIITLTFLLFIITSVGRTQPPMPGDNPTRSTNSLNRNRTFTTSSEPPTTGPIGTGTALLLGLGVSTIVYKIKRNKEEDKE